MRQQLCMFVELQLEAPFIRSTTPMPLPNMDWTDNRTVQEEGMSENNYGLASKVTMLCPILESFFFLGLYTAAERTFTSFWNNRLNGHTVKLFFDSNSGYIAYDEVYSQYYFFTEEEGRRVLNDYMIFFPYSQVKHFWVSRSVEGENSNWIQHQAPLLRYMCEQIVSTLHKLQD